MIKFFLALFFTFLFFSCASSPKENTAETLPLESENIAEENQAQEIENSQEQNPELSKEEIQPEKNSADENPPVPEEKIQEEIKLEPIEDIQGYYESDPEPVFLEKQEIIEPIEETEEIPLVPPEEKIQEEKSEPEKEEPASPEIPRDENAAEEIQTEQPELSAEKKPEDIIENENSKTEIPNAENSEEIISQPEIQNPETNVEENSAESTSQEEEKTEPEKVPVIPSRSVSMKNSQYLDIVYPGKGWIYLGEEDGKNLMRYFGRKIGDKNTSFSLRSREEGKTILHFYKNDQLTGAYIDDYLEVEIKGRNYSAERILAPDYSSLVPPSQKNSTQEKISSPEISNPKNEVSENSPKIPEEKAASKNDFETEKPSVQTSSEISSGNEVSPSQEISSIEKNNSSDSSADELLKAAQENFNSKKYKDSLACLESFFEKADSRIDEGLFLQAQIFESNSSERNIKNALDNYETIVRRYPQSSVWKKASERVTYLKKFYFNIR